MKMSKSEKNSKYFYTYYDTSGEHEKLHKQSCYVLSIITRNQVSYKYLHYAKVSRT